jgi:PAS domain S-box-containing protein
VARDVVIDGMSDGVFVIDEKKRILDLNAAAREIIGRNSEGAIGMKADQLLPFWKDLKENAQGLKAAGTELLLNDKIFDMRVSSLHDWRGRLNCQIIVVRDITENKRIEEELRRYSERLEELVEERTKEIRRYSEELEEIVKEKTRELTEAERLAAIGELAAMVGHDLRNPLTGIAGAVYIIKTNLASKADSKTKEMLEIIEKDILRSNKIISDLLDYSKELRLDLKETFLKQNINEALMAVGIPENIDIVDEVNSGLRMTVDIEQMKRVFINIIKNAVDAMPDGGKIVIKSEETEDNLKISFSDTGKGIPENIMVKLWKPLFTTKAKGMGFGLAICKRIVEAHQGKIFMESAINKGTKVTIILPIITDLDKIDKAPSFLKVPQSRS